jgi:hypothetical protein
MASISREEHGANSPSLEATGEHIPMGASSVDAVASDAAGKTHSKVDGEEQQLRESRAREREYLMPFCQVRKIKSDHRHY